MRLNKLIALLLAAVSATAAETNSIRSFALDELTVLRIPVSRLRVTTISYPSPIQAIEAALVTSDGRTPGLFQLSHRPGNAYFSVRALVKDAAANVNVVWNRRTYVLELVESDRPLLSVVLQEPVPVTAVASRPASPTRLLGLLETAKAYPLLAQHHPASVRQVEVARPRRVMNYGDFEIVLEEVFRFDPEDTLAFRVRLKNKSAQELRYQPQSFSVRVGERLYHQVLSDASGVVPPQGEVPAYFLITGSPNGGRNELSLKNEFTVLVSRLK